MTSSSFYRAGATRICRIREAVEHVLYWDRNSIDTLHAELRNAGV